MVIKPIKTEKILPGRNDLFQILDKYITSLKENSVLAITSKIISLCQGRILKPNEVSKENLIHKEAEYYIPSSKSKYNITLTIKNSLLIPTAGIDESNGNGYYILWPTDPQKEANNIKKYLCKRFSLNYAGVIITDSKTTPLRWGTTGVAIAYSGFRPLNNYIGKKDIFNRKLEVTKANVMDALACSAVLVMGEGNEQTPIVIIEDLPFVKFRKRNLTKKEIEELKISIDEDLYAPLLKSPLWEKGKE